MECNARQMRNDDRSVLRTSEISCHRRNGSRDHPRQRLHFGQQKLEPLRLKLQAAFDKFGILADQNQVLKSHGIPDRQNHATFNLQLLQQGRRNALGGRRADDGVEGPLVGPAVVTVSGADENIPIAERVQPLGG